MDATCAGGREGRGGGSVVGALVDTGATITCEGTAIGEMTGQHLPSVHSICISATGTRCHLAYA